MAVEKEIEYEIGNSINVGRKRAGKPNQDSMAVLMPRANGSVPPILIVADGMGGYAGGATASQIIIQRFNTLYTGFQGNEFSMQPFASQVINESLSEMQQKGAQDTQLANMGSTLVAVSLENGKVSIANVGDSRAYLFHAGEIIQLSYDHSFIGEAMRAGLLTPVQAMNHPKKNQLTQSISARRYEVKPYFADHPKAKDDIVVLCSDGLWGVVPEAVIQAIVIELSPQQAAEKLVKMANSRGGPDNISVIVARQKDAIPLNPFSYMAD